MTRPSFSEWMRQVDQAVVRLCGLSADDLPDYDYRGEYEDEQSPQASARHAIEAADDEMHDRDNDEDY